MEEVLPPQTESGAGFEPVRVRQFTVFLENQVGRLQTLVRAFEEAGGAILGLTIHNSADSALVRLICSDPELGQEVLHREGFSFNQQDLLVVQLPAKSQPLSSVCSALLAGEINIYYVYPLLTGPTKPALALYVDDLTLAAQILMKKGFTIVGESDLHT